MAVKLSPFDSSKALTLRQAIDTGRLTFRGRQPTLLIVQQWSNPNKGCKPLGPRGPVVVMPAVVAGREKLTMPEWIDWFIRERSTLLLNALRQATAVKVKTRKKPVKS